MEVAINYLISRTRYSLQIYIKFTTDYVFYVAEYQLCIFIKVIHNCIAAQMNCRDLVLCPSILFCPFCHGTRPEIYLNFTVICGIVQYQHLLSPNFIISILFNRIFYLRFLQNSRFLWKRSVFKSLKNKFWTKIFSKLLLYDQQFGAKYSLT